MNMMRGFHSLVSVSLLSLIISGCRQPEDDDVGDSGESETETTETVGDSDTGAELPAIPTLQLGFSQVKQFDFSWAPTYGANYYQLLERLEGGDAYLQIGADISSESISLTMPLHLRVNASYQLRACNDAGCVDSEPVEVTEALADAIGYFKASNSDEGDLFGGSVALSADGNTLALGARGEDSNAIGLDGSQASNAAIDAGAAYVFRRDPSGGWAQQAYVKPSNPNPGDEFGWQVALADDGNTLAVSSIGEDSGATGIAGNQADNTADEAGAVYLFQFDAVQGWAQQAYVKPSNTGDHDDFGWSLALSGDGATLAVGARSEASNATGIEGDPSNDAAMGSGAVYVFARDDMNTWTQQAYVKAHNTDPNDSFGYSTALSADGDTLAVGAFWEDGSAPGINGDPSDNLTAQAGAVYVFTRDPMNTWVQQAYVKASKPGALDGFGGSVALSATGDVLAVGAHGEDSSASSIDGDQFDDSATDAGAVYVFMRNDQDAWSQQAYVKPSNMRAGDRFGTDVALAADGQTLVVGATGEDSNAIGLQGDPTDNSALEAGAAYLFQYDPALGWRQRTYVKAPNTGTEDFFGDSVALAADAATLVISGPLEDAHATGIGGDQADDSTLDVGAVYVY